MTPTDPGAASRPAGNRPLSLADLADLIGAPVSGATAVAVTGVTHASGDVRPGDLYAALPGARTRRQLRHPCLVGQKLTLLAEHTQIVRIGPVEGRLMHAGEAAGTRPGARSSPRGGAA